MAGELVTHGGPCPRASRCCPWTANTTPSTSACTGAAQHEVQRLVLTASGGPFRDVAGRAPADRASRRRAAASDLADGAQDHHRLGDADEQGPRGHRGALAVRRAGRPHRCRRAPAVDRALDGGTHRRIDHRATRRHRHAAADSVRVLVSRAVGRAAAAAGPDPVRRAGVPAARHGAVPVSAAGLRRTHGRRDHAGGAQCGQRGRRGRVSGGAAAVSRHCRRSSNGRCRHTMCKGPTRWPASARRIAGRASIPGH